MASGVTGVARVAEVAGVAEVARIARGTGVTGVAEVARVARVTGLVEVVGVAVGVLKLVYGKVHLQFGSYFQPLGHVFVQVGGGGAVSSSRARLAPFAVRICYAKQKHATIV